MLQYPDPIQYAPQQTGTSQFSHVHKQKQVIEESGRNKAKIQMKTSTLIVRQIVQVHRRSTRLHT